MKWNWYESDFDEPAAPKYESFNINKAPTPTPAASPYSYRGAYTNEPPPIADSGSSGSGGGLWDTFTNRLSSVNRRVWEPLLPEYDPNAWYNFSPLDMVPGRFGATRKQADEVAEAAKPWIKTGYERIARPFSSPGALGITAATMGAGSLETLAGMDAAAVGASRFAPLLRATQPAAKAAVAAAATPTGQFAVNTLRGAGGLLGLKIAGEGLAESIGAGAEFYKNPTNENAAKIGGGLIDTTLGTLGGYAALHGGGPKKNPITGSFDELPIQVPERELGIPLPDQKPYIQGLQDIARRKQDIARKATSQVPLTQEEADILAEMLADPNLPPGPLKGPSIPTEAEILGQSRPYSQSEGPVRSAPPSIGAISYGDIGKKIGPQFEQPVFGPTPPTAQKIPAPTVSRFQYGPERPPAPGPEIPLQRAQELLKSADAMQKGGNIPGASILRQQVADSVRANGYGDWATTIESQIPGEFRNQAPLPPPPAAPPAPTPAPTAPKGPTPVSPEAAAPPIETPATTGEPRLTAEDLKGMKGKGYKIIPAGSLVSPDVDVIGRTVDGRIVTRLKSAAPPAPPATPRLRTGEGLKAAAPEMPILTAKDLAGLRGVNYQVIEPGVAIPEGAKVLGKMGGTGKIIIQPAEGATPTVSPGRIAEIKAGTAEPVAPSAFKPAETPKPAVETPKPVVETSPRQLADEIREAESFGFKVVKASEAVGIDPKLIKGELSDGSLVVETPAARPSRFRGTRPETATTKDPSILTGDEVRKQLNIEPKEAVRQGLAVQDEYGYRLIEQPSAFKGTRPETAAPATESALRRERLGQRFDEIVRRRAAGETPTLFPEGPPTGKKGGKKGSKFKGTRPETQEIAAAAEEAAAAAEVEAPVAEPTTGKKGKGGKKKVEYQSPEANELAGQRSKLDKADAPDTEYRKLLPRAARQEKLRSGETWRQRVSEQVHNFEAQAAAEAEFAANYPEAAKRPGEKGAIRISTRRQARADARAKAAAEQLAFENERISRRTGLTIEEIEGRRRIGEDPFPDLTETLNRGERKLGPQGEVEGRVPIGGRKKKTVEQVIQTAYNRKTANPIAAVLESSQLEKFDKDPQIFDKILAGDPSTKQATDYFTRAKRMARKEGVNYRSALKDMFLDISEEDFDKVFGKYDPKNPKVGASDKTEWSIEKIIDDIRQGETAGLTPKHKTPAQIAGFLEQRIRGAMANSEAWQDLVSSGIIRTSKPYNSDKKWEKIHPDLIPGQNKGQVIETKTGEKVTVTPDYWTDATTHDKLKAFFSQPDETWIKTAADWAQLPKNIFFAGGIPWTPINKHYFNIMNRAYKKGGWPEVKMMLQANKRDLNPELLKRMWQLANEGGMQTSAESRTLEHLGNKGVLGRLEKQGPVGRFAGKRVIEPLQRTFEKKFFQEKLPAFKTESGWAEFQKGLRAGLTREEAMRRAADLQNVFYGGVSDSPQGWFFNHPTMHQGARLGLLAPDWHQTKYKLAGNELKAAAGKGDPVYRESLRRGLKMSAFRRGASAAVGAAGASALNQFYPGTIPTNTGVKAPSGTQREVGIDLIGTSDELQRLPEIIQKAVQEKDPGYLLRYMAVNPLNLPVRSAGHLIEGHSATNEPLWSMETKFGKKISLGQATLRVLGEVAQNVNPPFANVMVRYAIGDITADQAIAEAAESPLVYHYIDQIDKSRGKTFGPGSRKFGPTTKKFGF